MSASKRQVYLLIAIIAAILSIIHFILSCYYTFKYGFADINIFLYSTLNYLYNGNLYLETEPLSATYEAGRSVLKFPPIYVVPYLPWLGGPADSSHGIAPDFLGMLFGLHMIRFVFVFLLLGFLIGPCRNILWWTTLAIIFVFSSPFYESLWGLTFDNLYLFLLGLSLLLIKYRHKLATATLLMYAANAKLYPFLQLLQFFAARNWKMLFYCFIATVFWIGISLIFFDGATHEFYYFRIVPVLLQEKVLCEVGNVSIAAQFCGMNFPMQMLDIFFIVVTMVIIYLASRIKNDSFETELLFLSFVICLPLLIMKNIWGNYQLSLIIPICVLISLSLSPEKKSLQTWLPAFFALIAWIPLVFSYNYMGMKLSYYAYVHEGITTFVTDNLRPFTPLVLWMTLGVLLLSGKKLSRTK